MIDLTDITTSIYYYDEKNGNKKYIREFSPLTSFRYAGNDFYLIKTNTSYKVCIQVSDTDLLSLWTVKNDITEYEAKKQFIKGIVENNITKKDIQTFIETPLKYKKQPE